MPSEQAEQSRSVREPGAGSKRTYQAPVLRLLGTVRELTLVSGCSTTLDNDGIPGSFKRVGS